MKRRRQLAVPFVMTVAAACGGQVDITGNPPEVVEDAGDPCANGMPGVGASCSKEGASTSAPSRETT
jgi:hypothetical protein